MYNISDYFICASIIWIFFNRDGSVIPNIDRIGRIGDSRYIIVDMRADITCYSEKTQTVIWTYAEPVKIVYVNLF